MKGDAGAFTKLKLLQGGQEMVGNKVSNAVDKQVVATDENSYTIFKRKLSY